MHGTYADTSIAFVDAKVAATMCKGNVIVYLVDEMSGVMDKWILDHVVPNMLRHGIDEQVCKVWGILYCGDCLIGVGMMPFLHTGGSRS
jgi:hypothetical protein